MVVQSIGEDDRTVVMDGGSAGRYLQTGHLVYAQGTALFAIPFDPTARTVRGGPVPLVEGLRRSSNGFSDTAYFAVSEAGTLVTVPANTNADGGARIERTLTWVDRNGREDPFPARPDEYSMARLSPDGTKVALVLGTALTSSNPLAIWIYDLRTENLSLLTADPAGDDGPVWSTDSSRIFFRSPRDGGAVTVFAIDVETGETELLASPSPDFPFVMPWTISPDDRTLGLVNLVAGGNLDVATLSLADGGELTELLHEEGLNENEPSFSPNGAWIAYQQASRDGTVEISIRPFPGVARTRHPVGHLRADAARRDAAETLRNRKLFPERPRTRVGRRPERRAIPHDSRDRHWRWRWRVTGRAHRRRAQLVRGAREPRAGRVKAPSTLRTQAT
jgi:dipeptidyl aminopeptidase/acylaminoacyl peptidase